MALTEQQQKAAALLVQRDINGMTLSEIAEDVGIHVATLHRWKNDKEFIQFQNNMAENVMESFVPELYAELRHLMRDSKDGLKLKAIELAMKNRGKLKQETELKVEVTQKTNEELEKEIEDMLNRSNV